MADPKTPEASDGTAAAAAGPSPTIADPVIKKGSEGRYHYLQNGPRRCNCEAIVTGINKPKGGPVTYELQAMIGGKARPVSGVPAYDETQPNRAGFQLRELVVEESPAE